MHKLPITIIATVLNETKSISKLLLALSHQTHKPKEIILTDGGSSDNTLDIIKQFAKENPSLPLSWHLTPGNRSVGRNHAIAKVKTNWIAITDAGCIPQPDWLEKLWAAHTSSDHNLVTAGYYKGLPENKLQEAMIPYFLVMPDKLDKNTFLPATRSMLISKKIWQKLGGFDEQLSDNEDYAFAKKLKREKIKIKVADQAIVGWQPPKTLYKFAKTIYRFARGDVQAKIIRPKVLLIFIRYIAVFLFFFILANLSFFRTLWLIFFTLLILYSWWSISKNYRYTKGWYYLPILQITSDMAVMAGSISGLKPFLPIANP